MKKRIILPLISVTIFFLSFASFALAECDYPGVESLQLPVYPSASYSPKFKYSYRIRKGDLGSPTILVLGGGPGQNTIAPGAAPILGAFPSNYTLIYTDPRSVGCNDTYQFTDDALTSLTLAHDVAALIKHLQDQNMVGENYYIYGASFGTQHATVLAKLLAQLGITLPKGVILEGVSGHHFSGFQDYFSHFQTEWQRIKAKDLSPNVRTFFDSALPSTSSVNGFSSKIWGQFLSLQIILGYLPQAKQQFKHLIEWYLTDSDGKKAAQSQLVGLVSTTQDGLVVPIDKIFRAIGCREIWGEFYAGRDVVKGNLTAIGENICSETLMTNPYDSKSWQIPVPIYYFQGVYDPTTTLEQAKYHFEHQTSPRMMVVVEHASHAPLSLALRPCADQIWKAITSAPEKLEAVVGSCGAGLGTKIQFLSKH